MPAPLTLRPSLSQAARREKLLVVLMSLATQGAYKVSEELLVVLMSLATQGVYKVSEKRNLEFRNTFISSLKGKVAASFSEQTEGL